MFSPGQKFLPDVPLGNMLAMCEIGREMHNMG